MTEDTQATQPTPEQPGNPVPAPGQPEAPPTSTPDATPGPDAPEAPPAPGQTPAPAQEPAQQPVQAAEPVQEPTSPPPVQQLDQTPEQQQTQAQIDELQGQREEQSGAQKSATTKQINQLQSDLEEQRPVGVVYGGDRQILRNVETLEPVQVAREQDSRNVAGLAYASHGQQATDENGETQPIVVAHPVRVDGRNRRSDADALEGQKCEIVDGEFKGRKGIFFSVERHDPQSGYPTQVIVQAIEDEYERLSVPYSYIRPVGTLR